MSSKYYQENKEHVKLKVKEWRQNNPERVKENRRAYYLKNRERIIQKAKDWEEKNHERKRQRNRLRRLEKEYGITQKQFTDMLSAQGGRCAICNGVLKSEMETHIDHCHERGHVRSVLCGACNRGLGVLEKDQGRWLGKALIYLAKHKTSGVLEAGMWRAQ